MMTWADRLDRRSRMVYSAFLRLAPEARLSMLRRRQLYWVLRGVVREELARRLRRAALLSMVLLLFASQAAHAGAWDDSSPKVREWFWRLLVPGTRTPCCGSGNAVEADDFEVDGDRYVAIVTDGHGLVPEGKRITIPNHRRNVEDHNPTGHGILFLDGGGQPICYVAPSGG